MLTLCVHTLSAENTLLYCAGPVAVILNTSTHERVYVPSLDGGGVGAVTVHPSLKYFAVGERCSHRAPNIYIYEFPSLEIYRVLREGTEAG